MRPPCPSRTCALALADARRLPLRSGSIDGAFAAGLLPHLPDPGLGLAELARVIAPTAGWCCYDDGPDRFLAVAERVSPWP